MYDILQVLETLAERNEEGDKWKNTKARAARAFLT